MSATISPSIASALRSAIIDLARARTALAESSAELKRRRDAFAAENAALIENVKRDTENVNDMDREVRDLALTQYRLTNTRELAAGVQVKLFNRIAYKEADAFAWAMKTGLALKPACLDIGAFEKIAIATPLEFVTYTEDPQVQIAKQLPTAAAPTETAAPAAAGA